MYILTRKNRVIDYCESGYLYVGNIVVCNEKNCNFEDATIVKIEGTLPEDIDGALYDYISGEFVKVQGANPLGISQGGTGGTTPEESRTNLGAAPAYSYGTEDLIAGSSELETGKLYFVYE